MPRITVGVPVYNAESYIHECLSCLEGQTFRDFEVLIYDNASTDRTGERCAVFLERDRRFKYVRQNSNKGPTANFVDVLEAAQSPFFLWRAHDDLCSPNFLEVTHNAIAEWPGAKLAVGRVERVGAKTGTRRVIDLNHGFESLRLARVLWWSEPSWFYGLWRRETLTSEFAAVWSLYPHGWGSDHLTLLRPLVQNAVRGSNATAFIQRFLPRHVIESEDGVERSVTAASAAELQQLKDRFLNACRTLLDQIELTPMQKRSLAILLPLYADKRVRSAFKILLARLGETLAARQVRSSTRI